MSLVSKYLAGYAEPDLLSEPGMEACLKAGPFDRVMVIPSFGESAAVLSALRSVRTADRHRGGVTLVVLVVNAPAEADEAMHLRNLETVEALGFERGFVERGGPLFLVDRYSKERCLQNGGVGEARKVGCDLALHLIETGAVKSPTIAQTDADAELPPEYWGRIEEQAPESYAALLLPFEHREEAGVIRGAIWAYEIWLRYYVLGLRWARSSYAFHSIGSTIVTHALSYAKVRGMPKRRAGEDFWFLNKLAKLKFRPSETVI